MVYILLFKMVYIICFTNLFKIILVYMNGKIRSLNYSWGRGVFFVIKIKLIIYFNIVFIILSLILYFVCYFNIFEVR